MRAEWLLALSAMLFTPDTQTLRGAKITGYGATPSFGSGILMVLRSVQITTADGSGRTLYFIHGDANTFLGRGKGEPYPPIGSTCDFSTTARHIASDQLGDGGPDSPIGNVITDIRCDHSSSSN
jgi:hypothetical protein